MVKKYEDQVDYWVSEKDDGIYDAMNEGIRLSRGELVGLINADDYYSPNIFQSIVESYMKTNVNVIYGDLNYIGENSHNVIVAHETGRRYGLFPNSLKWIWVKMLFGHPAAFITRRTYKKYGLYNTVFKISGDYELFIRLYKHKVKFYNLKKTIANFRIGGVSTSSSDKLLLKENEVARRLHSRIPSMLINNFLKIQRIVKGCK
jgi:glycosyltransferase involved in cell wall biosynthesis